MVHVIDDDAGVRKSLGLLMQSASLAVRLYESGEDFLEAVDPKQPGCMVLDLRMPGLSGIEVLQQLRANHNEIPAIIISGHADAGTTFVGPRKISRGDQCRIHPPYLSHKPSVRYRQGWHPRLRFAQAKPAERPGI
jgi:CheY-like chemotaxis protein